MQGAYTICESIASTGTWETASAFHSSRPHLVAMCHLVHTPIAQRHGASSRARLAQRLSCVGPAGLACAGSRCDCSGLACDASTAHTQVPRWWWLQRVTPPRTLARSQSFAVLGSLIFNYQHRTPVASPELLGKCQLRTQSAAQQSGAMNSGAMRAAVVTLIVLAAGLPGKRACVR